MTKAELIAKMAEQAKLTKVEAGKALDAVTDAISAALAAGEKLTLTGFGTLSTTVVNWTHHLGGGSRTLGVLDMAHLSEGWTLWTTLGLTRLTGNPGTGPWGYLGGWGRMHSHNLALSF